uniref:PBP1A family penicillin-binding protein n=1 Tax=Agathobacter sp. TaxID=2021311 RepID=UPI004056B8E8
MTKEKKKKKHRFFWFMVKIQILLMLIVIAGLLYYNYSGYAKTIQVLRKEAVTEVWESTERDFIPEQASFVYDTHGELISYTKGEKNSDYVEYEEIPSAFVAAMISTEDKKFYQHSGVDYLAILRSAKAILESGELSQGGSTITMQLARNIYLNNGKNWERKVKEVFIALELEKRYSKNKIMEFYLNNIYFANGYYGIQAACEGYFSCKLEELSLSQIAFLCAIPNSPSYYDPIINAQNTLARRDRILENMYQDGWIAESEYLQAKEEEIVLNQSRSAKVKYNNYVDTYVFYCATRALMEQEGFVFQEYFSSEEEEKTYYEAYDELYAECRKKINAHGCKIYTSIDLELQEELQESVNKVLSGFTATNEEGVYQLQGAAVSIDNTTGYVVAIVGGREQDIGIYTLNRAYQSHRQPGSSIKPLIVYTPFFEKGNTPDTLVMDEEIEGGPKAGYYHGEVTTRFAVEQSLNPVAWQLYTQITPEVGLSYLKNMHFSSIEEADYVPATALGGFTRGVSALEMASAYAAIQNDGNYRMPTCIKRIVDSEGIVLYESEQEEVRIYSETASRMMTDVLMTAMESGTGKKARLSQMPCAGKTGTTNDYKDGWFVGYTRYYTTSVWVGCDIPKAVEDLQGGTYPAQIWKDYMEKVHKDMTVMNFLPYAQLSQEFIDTYYPAEEETQQPQEGEGADQEAENGEGNAQDEGSAQGEGNPEDEGGVQGEENVQDIGDVQGEENAEGA